MISLLITIVFLILLAMGLRALRRRFKAVDNIFYIILLIVFILTWVNESFWWALFTGVIVLILGVIFLGIGSQTEVTRRHGTYTLPECDSCGFNKLKIIKETESTVSTICPRCGKKVLFHLNGGIPTNNYQSYPQNDFTEKSTLKHSKRSDDKERDWERRQREKEEQYKREEKERCQEEYERLKDEYERLKSKAKGLYSQAESYLRDAEDHMRKALEYNDEDHERCARDCKDKAKIYLNEAENVEKEANYYYNQALKYR